MYNTIGITDYCIPFLFKLILITLEPEMLEYYFYYECMDIVNK